MPELDSPQGTPTPAATPVPVVPNSSAGVQASPFYSFRGPDGKEETYKTKDELDKAMRESFLRQSDYTRKTQGHAQALKEFEAKQKEFDQRQKDFEKREKRADQYAEWDRILKTRPEIERQLLAIAQRGASPDEMFERTSGLIDEKSSVLEERIKALEEDLKMRDIERQRDSIFQELSTQYPDFDPAVISAGLDQLSGDESLRPLIETIYFASKGRLSPAQAEKKVLDDLKMKKGAALPGGGGTPPDGKKPKYATPEEARAAYHAEHPG